MIIEPAGIPGGLFSEANSNDFNIIQVQRRNEPP